MKTLQVNKCELCTGELDVICYIDDIEICQECRDNLNLRI